VSAAVALAVVVYAATAIAQAPPILATGPWSVAGLDEGYGQVRPSIVDNRGDEVVSGIHWHTWGGPRAIGTGMSFDYVGPHQIVPDFGAQQTATVVAFHLANCHGRRAYTAIEWYFPQHGQHFSPANYIDACTGTYSGSGTPAGQSHCNVPPALLYVFPPVVGVTVSATSCAVAIALARAYQQAGQGGTSWRPPASVAVNTASGSARWSCTFITVREPTWTYSLYFAACSSGRQRVTMSLGD
jgi:hypothetical protein